MALHCFGSFHFKAGAMDGYLFSKMLMAVMYSMYRLFKGKNHKDFHRKVHTINLMVTGERGRDVDCGVSWRRGQIAVMVTDFEFIRLQIHA